LMKIVRFAAAPDGGSQFVEIDFPVDNASTDAWGLPPAAPRWCRRRARW